MNSNDNLFIFGERLITRSEFEILINRYNSLFTQHKRIMIQSSDPLEQNVALILSRNLNCELFLCHSYFNKEQVQMMSDTYNIDLLLWDGWLNDSEQIQKRNISSDEKDGTLNVFTSGTTNEAKIAQHKWSSIQYSSTFIKNNLSNCTWMMTYSSTSYAGLQVFFSAFNNNGIIYYPPSDFEMVSKEMFQNKVEVVSGTPTYWRMLISSWPDNVKPLRLKQITLGGELVDQDILDNIQSFFKPDNITHIYASTEAGTAIVVSDGQAGFPKEYLNRDHGVLLRVVDNVLQVKTPAAMTRYVKGETKITDDGWLITGDVVEQRDNRVFFKGRQDGMINVGGMKVLPEEVETALQSFDEVVNCRVFAKQNPILGSVVAAELVLSEDTTLDQKSIKMKLRKILAEHKIPRFLLSVSQIEVSPHGKKYRK